MLFAGISLAIGLASTLDDDSAGIEGFVEVAFAMIIVAILLIGFVKLEDFIIRRVSPVKRILWLRRLGLRAWR